MQSYQSYVKSRSNSLKLSYIVYYYYLGGESDFKNTTGHSGNAVVFFPTKVKSQALLAIVEKNVLDLIFETSCDLL